MNQVVKIQINAHLEDVLKISAATLEQTTDQLETLRRLISRVKTQLSIADILRDEDRASLKLSLEELEQARILLSKIDIRLSDVAEVSSALVSVVENPQTQTVLEPEVVK